MNGVTADVMSNIIEFNPNPNQGTDGEHGELTKRCSSMIDAAILGGQLVTTAEELVVSGAESAEQAKAFALKLNAVEKAIETRRTEIVKPLNDELKDINALAKKLAVPFINAKNLISRKLMTWQNEVRAAEEAARKQRQIAEAEALLKSQKPVMTPIVPISKPQEKVLSTRKTFTFAVVDFDQVPKKYTKVVIDEQKVNDDIKAGIPSIPGLKIEWRETPIYR